MQALRDAAILLVMMLVLASVRVSRVEPVSIDLVPSAHAAQSGATVEPVSATVGNAAGHDDGTEHVDCQVRVLRIETRDDGGAALAASTQPRVEARAPRACRIG